jgi:fructokinase
MPLPSTEEKTDDPVIIAAVEGGGTSFRVAVCQVVVGSTPIILHRTQVNSSHDRPQDTLAECAAFLKEHKPAEGYHALGIATFGPVGVRPDDAATYGRILETSPKASWRTMDLLSPLQHACRGSTRPLVVQVETDVNAPALAEYLEAKKVAPDLTSTAYITVGTGVGVGLVVNGLPVHGRMHPEGGHVPVQPLQGDTVRGYSWGQNCPFQGVNTVEGLASSVALTERLEQLQGKPLSRSVLSTLSDDHEVWKHAANAVANLCVTLLLTVSVEKIVLGGGIMQRKGLLEQIQAQTRHLLNRYLSLPDDLSTLITTSEHGEDAGQNGAIVLAERALVNGDDKDNEREKTRLKQTAFKHGLWHGFLVGAVGTALVCKLLWRSSKR